MPPLADSGRVVTQPDRPATTAARQAETPRPRREARRPSPTLGDARGRRARRGGTRGPTSARPGLSVSERDPEADAVPGLTRNRNLRSEGRRSMCSAIHITSRTWLRPSSTREPSDPPSRVVRATALLTCSRHHRSRHTGTQTQQSGHRATAGGPAAHRARCLASPPSHSAALSLPTSYARRPASGDRRLAPPSAAWEADDGRPVDNIVSRPESPQLSRPPTFPAHVNDPSAGSPTETLLRLLLPLNDRTRATSRLSTSALAGRNGANPKVSLDHSIGSSDGRCVQRAGT